MGEKAFHGYCMDKDGYYITPVHLTSVDEVFSYCELHKHFNYEVRIVEPIEDAEVVKILEGEYVFPEEWKRFNIKKDVGSEEVLK